MESGLWGWKCKSSIIEKENCALRCLSPACYQLIYESDPLEEGERDFNRSHEYKYCLHRPVGYTSAIYNPHILSLSLRCSAELKSLNSGDGGGASARVDLAAIVISYGSGSLWCSTSYQSNPAVKNKPHGFFSPPATQWIGQRISCGGR
ncbi:hypothetical protein KSP40_PGU017604 [Platanthera guangdongensis]|uniref:Uncharacterized protein n=1 Tax=Platanthera guangdongensis TaxID=2320717 RepID=A0ABR2LRD8_9ASPA